MVEIAMNIKLEIQNMYMKIITPLLYIILLLSLYDKYSLSMYLNIKFLHIKWKQLSI